MFVFPQIKLIITLIGFLLLGIGIYSGIKYYNDSQAIIEELNRQTVALMQSVDLQRETIIYIEKAIKEQALIRDDLTKRVAASKKDLDKTQKTIIKHDLKIIANKKANLLEKTINNGTVNMLRCFELASGGQILINEKNNQCPNIFTNN